MADFTHAKKIMENLLPFCRLKIDDDERFKAFLIENGLDPDDCEPEEVVEKINEYMKETVKRVKARR